MTEALWTLIGGWILVSVAMWTLLGGIAFYGLLLLVAWAYIRIRYGPDWRRKVD